MGKKAKFHHVISVIELSKNSGYLTVLSQDIFLLDAEIRCIFICTSLYMIIATFPTTVFINQQIYLVVADKLCVYIFSPVISVCTWPYFLSLFSPHSDTIISGNMMIQLNMWVAKLDKIPILFSSAWKACVFCATGVYGLIFNNTLWSISPSLDIYLKTAIRTQWQNFVQNKFRLTSPNSMHWP